MEIIALNAKNCVSVLTSALQELYLCSVEQDEVQRDALVISQMRPRWICVLIQCLRGSFVAEVHPQSRPPPLLPTSGLMLTRHIGNIDSLPRLKWKERGLGFHLHLISNKLQKQFGHFARVKDSTAGATAGGHTGSQKCGSQVQKPLLDKKWGNRGLSWGKELLEVLWSRDFNKTSLSLAVVTPVSTATPLIFAHVSRSSPKHLVRLLPSWFFFPLKTI